LLRLVAGEDDDLPGDAQLAGQQAPHERLAERSGAARDEDGGALDVRERHVETSVAYSASISSHDGMRRPVSASKRLPSSARLMRGCSTGTISCPRPVSALSRLSRSNLSIGSD